MVNDFREVVITKCSRARSWYEELVGQKWYVIGFDGKEYEALEPDGHRNFILAEDAELVE